MSKAQEKKGPFLYKAILITMFQMIVLQAKEFHIKHFENWNHPDPCMYAWHQSLFRLYYLAIRLQADQGWHSLTMLRPRFALPEHLLIRCEATRQNEWSWKVGSLSTYKPLSHVTRWDFSYSTLSTDRDGTSISFTVAFRRHASNLEWEAC